MSVDRESVGCVMVVAVEVACPHRIAVDCRGQTLACPGISPLFAHLLRYSAHLLHYSAHPVCFWLSSLSLQRADPPCPEKSTRFRSRRNRRSAWIVRLAARFTRGSGGHTRQAWCLGSPGSYPRSGTGRSTSGRMGHCG